MIGTSPLEEKLAALGPSAAPPEAEKALYSIAGRSPRWVVFPGTTEEASEVLRLAHECRAPAAFWGGGTLQDLGNPPGRVDVILGTRRMTGILDHEAANLTVTVRAGMTFKSVQEHLRSAGQRLPWEVPFPEKTTIGGAVAANASGPCRYRWGTARDLMIGIRVVLSDGAVVKNGGKVVKNVTGYDFRKLFVGSLGTVGLIAEATFKVAPIPPASLSVAAALDAPGPLFQALLSRELPLLFPEAIDFWRLLPGGAVPNSLGPASGKAPVWGAAVRFAGNPGALARQAEGFESLFKRAGARLCRLEGEAEAALWDHLLHAPWNAVSGGVRIRFSAAPSGLGRFVGEAAGFLPKALFSGRAGQGVGWMTVPVSEIGDPSDFRFKELVRAGHRTGTALWLESCPAVWKEATDAWLTPVPEAFLFQRLKKAFDPEGILNPGRFAQRI